MTLRPWLIILTSALAACARRDDSAPPATDTVTLADSADSTWSITPTGFGRLKVGMSAEDASAASGGTLIVPAATTAEQCDYATWSAAPTGVRVMFEGGTLARVDISAPGIPTPEGLQVGDSSARAVSLYAGRAERRPLKYEEGEYFIVRPLAPQDTIQRLVIEVAGGRVSRFRVGRYPAVEYVEGCS